VSYYLRQEGSGLILGPYEQRATPAWLEGIPEDFSFRLWDDDLDRVESYIEAAYRRVPVLASAGVKRVVNGPIPYSPDGLPYLGPAHGLPNFYHCNTFSFGIAQAGGAGKSLAEWVIQGAPEWDLCAWILVALRTMPPAAMRSRRPPRPTNTSTHRPSHWKNVPLAGHCGARRSTRGWPAAERTLGFGEGGNERSGTTHRSPTHMPTRMLARPTA